jgi:hypothetical protein
VLAACSSVEAAAEEEAAHWAFHEGITLRGRTQETPTAVPID